MNTTQEMVADALRGICAVVRAEHLMPFDQRCPECIILKVADIVLAAHDAEQASAPPSPRVSVPEPGVSKDAEGNEWWNESSRSFRKRVIESLRAQGVEVVP